jgi:LysR family transcriptional activator of nhaA
MDWLNYHHLLYFYTVAREGGLAPAAEVLHLAHPTISAQIHTLERSLGHELFERSGRRLVLTEMGRMVYRYADDIFGLGREMLEVMKGRQDGRVVRLTVGVADALPKMVVHRLLEPALRFPDPLTLIVHDNKPDRLLGELATHSLDVILTDSPVGAGSAVKAFSHLLGECGIMIFAAPALAARHRRRFPASLDQAPFLLPTENSSIRRSMDLWFHRHGIRPRIIAEIEDSALLKVLAADGLGLFPAPSILEKDLNRQHGLRKAGTINEVKERFYALTIERKLRHPAVAAICEAAREELFA